MCADLDDLKVARLIHEAKGVDGRVKLQKIVYLLMAMGFDFPYDDFRILQRGPYSPSLAATVDCLSACGLVVQEKEDLGTATNGTPIVRYNYRVTKEIGKLLKELKIGIPTGGPRARFPKAIRLLASTNVYVLEVAATILYLRDEDGLSGKHLESELKLLKGHLLSHFDAARAFLSDLKSKGLLRLAT